MDRVKMRNWIIILMLLCSSLGLFSSCAVEENADTSVIAYQVCLWNRSEFELQHVFIYDKDELYKDAESILTVPMADDAEITSELPAGTYKITVTRRQSTGGRLYAYTTAYPITLSADTRIEYFQDSFRRSDIEEGNCKTT